MLRTAVGTSRKSLSLSLSSPVTFVVRLPISLTRSTAFWCQVPRFPPFWWAIGRLCGCWSNGSCTYWSGAASSAAAPSSLTELITCASANVSGTAPYHVGRFPSSRIRPSAWLFHCVYLSMYHGLPNDVVEMTVALLYRSTFSWRPLALTGLPHPQTCGSRVLHPSLWYASCQQCHFHVLVLLWHCALPRKISWRSVETLPRFGDFSSSKNAAVLKLLTFNN